MNYNRWRKNELSPKSRLRSVKHIKEHSHTQAPKCINEDELPQQESRQQNRPDQCQQRRVFECHGRSMHAASVSSNFCSCLGTALCSHPATAEWRQGRRDDPCPWVPQDKHNQIMRVNLLPPRGPTCQFLPGCSSCNRGSHDVIPVGRIDAAAFIATLVSGAGVGDCRLILKFPLTLRFEETGWNLVLAIAHRREWEW
jgi:hypothetical protein